MARDGHTFEELMEVAKRYGLDDNQLFISCAKQYDLQQKVIQSIRDEIENASLTTEKSYIKGNSNMYANPLVRELPKHSDAANKTLGMMLKTIETLGKQQHETKSKLDELINE